MKLFQKIKSLKRPQISDELRDQITHTLLGVIGLGAPMVILTNYTGSHPLTVVVLSIALASFGGVFEGYLVRQDSYERTIESVYDQWDADSSRLRSEMRDWKRQNVIDTARLCELRTEIEDARSKILPIDEYVSGLDRKAVQALSSDVYKHHLIYTKGFKAKVDELFPNDTYVPTPVVTQKIAPTHPDVTVATLLFTGPEKTELKIQQVPDGILEEKL